MSAPTRADREAAVLLYRMNDLAAPDDQIDLAAYAEWASEPERAAHVSRGERKRLDRYASHFEAHRLASTASLREAADSLANAADACVMGHCGRDDMMPAIKALRAALNGDAGKGGSDV